MSGSRPRGQLVGTKCVVRLRSGRSALLSTSEPSPRYQTLLVLGLLSTDLGCCRASFLQDGTSTTSTSETGFLFGDRFAQPLILLAVLGQSCLRELAG